MSAPHLIPQSQVVVETSSTRKDGTTFKIRLVKPPVANVVLIDHMQNPVQTIGKLVRTYQNQLDETDLPPEEIDQKLRDVRNSQLKTPLEMLYFVFLIRNVTRSYTHQIVRYRIGTSFTQESLRMAGRRSSYDVLVGLPVLKDDKALEAYWEGTVSAIDAYEYVMAREAPIEEARGLLPHNILTGLFYGCSFLALLNYYRQRMCCQAQPGEHQPVLLQIKNHIESQLGYDISRLLSSAFEERKSCGYHASFDRPCTWRQKEYKGYHDIARLEWGMAVEGEDDNPPL